jgi:8-oxo-dGTP pyrophosphatase MutT (NUDIX family)
MWCSCPGGHLDTGEEPEQAVLRELREEFEIDVSELTPLLKHVEEKGEFRGMYHSFVATLVTPVEEVKCNEGVRAEFFPPEIAIDLPQHPVSRLFLQTYMESHKAAA